MLKDAENDLVQLEQMVNKNNTNTTQNGTGSSIKKQ